jgi:hypothetical protein
MKTKLMTLFLIYLDQDNKSTLLDLDFLILVHFKTIFSESNLKVIDSYFFICEAFKGGSIYQAANSFSQIFYSIFLKSNAQFKSSAFDFQQTQ